MLGTLLAFTLIALSALRGAGGSPAEALQSVLGNDDIEIIYPEDPSYRNASRAFNRRLHFRPLAVAYPSSTEELAELVKAGAYLGLPGKSHFTSIDCTLTRAQCGQ